MDAAKISIVIPTYNRAKSLPIAIDSVISQNNTNWELIIVDDGSIDDTKEIVKGYLIDPRIRYYYQGNEGVSSARNVGVDISNGLYVIFLDSDDYFYPNLLDCLNAIDVTTFDIICWKILKVQGAKKIIWKPQDLGGLYNNIKASFLAGSICYNKEIFLKAGGFDPNMKFGENYELGIRISQLNHLKVGIMDEILMVYQISLQRESSSLSNKLSSYIYQYRKHRNTYKNNKKAKAKMNYLLGYVFEKSNKRRAAVGQYLNSWTTNPFNLKPLIKVLYLKLFR